MSTASQLVTMLTLTVQLALVPQWSYSWNLRPKSVGVEIGSLKEHSCHAVQTRPAVDHVLEVLGPIPVAMDEPLVSAMPGLVPRPTCGLTFQQAADRTVAWMAYAYNAGIPAIDLIEAWPHHSAERILQFTEQLHRRVGLRGLTLDITFGINAHSSQHIQASLAQFRSATRAWGLRLTVIITPQDAPLQLLHVWAMEDPPDELRFQNWIPGEDEEVLQWLRWMQRHTSSNPGVTGVAVPSSR